MSVSKIRNTNPQTADFDASDKLSEAIAILNGWAAIASSEDGLAALGTTKGGADAVFYSIQDLIRRLNEIRTAVES